MKQNKLTLIILTCMALSILPFAFANPSCGSSVNDTVMDGDLSCSGEGFRIDSNNTILDCAGYTLYGSDTQEGINLFNRANITIKNCNLVNFSYGIFTYGSPQLTIINTNISLAGQYGLYLTEETDGDLYNVTIFNSTDAIVLSDGDFLVDNLHLFYNENGILMQDVFDTTTLNLTNSHIHNNTENGVFINDIGYAILSFNNISDNGEDGLYLKAIDTNATLLNNSICYNLGSGGQVDSSCPFIYGYDGETYQFVNDAFPLAKLWFLDEVPGFVKFLAKIGIVKNIPGIRDTTYSKIPFDLAEKDGKYEIRIREEYDERSYVDNVELWVIDHSQDVEVYPNRYGSNIVSTPKELRLPVSCIDNTGNDCLALVSDMGDEVLKLKSNDYVVFDFGDLSNEENIKMVISKGAVGSQNVKRFEVLNTDGEWVEADYEPGKIVNLQGFATSPNVFDISDIFQTNEYKIRIHAEDLPFFDREFDERLVVDFVGIDTSNTNEEVQVTKLSPSKANLVPGRSMNMWSEIDVFESEGYELPEYSLAQEGDASGANEKRVERGLSAFGDVTSLVSKDDCYFATAKKCESQAIIEFGDELQLEFDVPALEEGKERDFVIVTNGAYEKLDASEHTDIYIADGQEGVGSGNTCYTSYGYNDDGADGCELLCVYADSDGDGINDNLDKLLFNETNVTTSGVTSLNISVEGAGTNESYYVGKYNVTFYDGNSIIANFTHNFSTANLDLSRVTILKSSTGLVVNFSGQLQANKTLFIEDNSFISLCVKDEEISSISSISSSCDGTNETDFTSCLGGAYNASGIRCTDLGDTIKIENLEYSGILGTQASSSGSSGSSSSGGSSSRRSSSTDSYTPKTYTFSNEQVEDGFTQENLWREDQVVFSYLGEHVLTLEDFEVSSSGGVATFKLTPKGESLTIAIGEDVEVDLNTDGRDDVLISVEDIIRNRVIVSIKATGNEPAQVNPPTNVSAPQEVVEETMDEETTSSSKWIWIVLILVLLLVLGGAYWYFKGKKN